MKGHHLALRLAVVGVAVSFVMEVEGWWVGRHITLDAGVYGLYETMEMVLDKSSIKPNFYP